MVLFYSGSCLKVTRAAAIFSVRTIRRACAPLGLGGGEQVVQPQLAFDHAGDPVQFLLAQFSRRMRR